MSQNLASPAGLHYAYFSMEIGLEPLIPTYSGGLGVLAGDTLRAAADLELPVVAVSLVHRNGYFRQRLSADGTQSEEQMTWSPEHSLHPCLPRIQVQIEGRKVYVAAWRYHVRGVHHYPVPVYLLDTRLEENGEFDRTLTDGLYAGDRYYRLCQEVVLGEGGVTMLNALGYSNLRRYHMNEGHAALVVPTLMAQHLASHPASPGIDMRERMVAAARRHCVFTTHTPVEAGHDKFPKDLALQVLGKERWELLERLGCTDTLNMTEVALRGSHFVNGVAMRHSEVSREMFPGYPIHAITNGIHSATWASPSMQALFDKRLPGWRKDSFTLRYAISLPPSEIWGAHQQSKQELVNFVRESCGIGLEPERLTIGFARRATAYKRALLIFRDLPRLLSLADRYGGLQLVFGGKAHPHDYEGKEIIKKIYDAARALSPKISVAFIENYDMTSCKKLVAGVDVWLNTPRPPLEASGTSGMKAALNGVPSLSVLDGWWVEGCIEGRTGWSIGEDTGASLQHGVDFDQLHAQSLYDRLENLVMPVFYGNHEKFVSMMRDAIALNASFFNTERMMGQYYHDAYRDRSTEHP